MKIKDVPQDDCGFLKEGKVRDLCYAVDENGNYRQVLSTGWEPKNEAMKQSWALINETAEEIRQNVLQGKISPIAYYMGKNVMDVKLVASYTGISRWKVKRHMKPVIFKKLKPSVLLKYAELFNISVEDLIKVNNKDEDDRFSA
jgi:hypothetical protein